MGASVSGCCRDGFVTRLDPGQKLVGYGVFDSLDSLAVAIRSGYKPALTCGSLYFQHFPILSVAISHSLT